MEFVLMTRDLGSILIAIVSIRNLWAHETTTQSGLRENAIPPRRTFSKRAVMSRLEIEVLLILQGVRRDSNNFFAIRILGSRSSDGQGRHGDQARLSGRGRSRISSTRILPSTFNALASPFWCLTSNPRISALSPHHDKTKCGAQEYSAVENLGGKEVGSKVAEEQVMVNELQERDEHVRVAR